MKQTDHTIKEENFITSVTKHMKELSHKVMKFDTRDEILRYTAQMFADNFKCDLIAIGTIANDHIQLSSTNTKEYDLSALFPYPLAQIDPLFFEKSMNSKSNEFTQSTQVSRYFQQIGFKSWFTVPLVDEKKTFGLCIVGYREQNIIYDDLQSRFDEMGRFIGVALNLITRNEEKERSLFKMQLLSSDSDLPAIIKNLVEKTIVFCGRETNSRTAAIYLFNETKDKLMLYQPVYGINDKKSVIPLAKDNSIHAYFPNVETIGYTSMTIPLTVGISMIGVLYVQKETGYIYTSNDLNNLKMYANYFTVMYENSQLTNKEHKQKENLQELLKIQQAMLHQTIHSENFTQINASFGKLFNSSIVLYDRYFNLIDYYLKENDSLTKTQLVSAGKNSHQLKNKEPTNIAITEKRNFKLLELTDGSELHGYFALENTDKIDPELFDIVLSMVRNIYSLQFIKKEIKTTSIENIKSDLVSHLFSEQIKDPQKLATEASAFNWDLHRPYYTAILALREQPEAKGADLLEIQTKNNAAFALMKQIISRLLPSAITVIFEQQLLLFVPKNSTNEPNFWQTFFKRMQHISQREGFEKEFVLGIGALCNHPKDYNEAYQKAGKTVNVLLKDKLDINYAAFDQLGSYTVLNTFKDDPTTELFVRKYLKKLHLESQNSQTNLFKTLAVYLNNNGNVTQTAKELYLHRSTLVYRLNKIQELLDIDIDDANERFNLQLAYKMSDLYDDTIFE